MSMTSTLEKILKQAKITKSDFARLMQVQPQIVHSWLTRGEFLPSNRIEQIAKVLGLTPNDLFGWEEINHDKIVKKSQDKYSSHIQIEHVSAELSAGYGSQVEEERGVDFVSFDKSYLSTLNISNPKNVRVVTCRGDSMHPLIKPNEKIIIDTGVNEYQGEGIYSCFYHGDSIIKRLQRIENKIKVSSENPTYESFWVDEKSDFKISGRLILTFKEF